MSEDVERVAAIKAELARHGGVAFSEGSTHCLCGAPLDTAEVKMPLREHLARAIADLTPAPNDLREFYVLQHLPHLTISRRAV